MTGHQLARGHKPVEFDAQMENVSVPLGKDAVFTCRVNQNVKSDQLQVNGAPDLRFQRRENHGECFYMKKIRETDGFSLGKTLYTHRSSISNQFKNGSTLATSPNKPSERAV